jgi:hypothetical protein
MLSRIASRLNLVTKRPRYGRTPENAIILHSNASQPVEVTQSEVERCLDRMEHNSALREILLDWQTNSPESFRRLVRSLIDNGPGKGREERTDSGYFDFKLPLKVEETISSNTVVEDDTSNSNDQEIIGQALGDPGTDETCNFNGLIVERGRPKVIFIPKSILPEKQERLPFAPALAYYEPRLDVTCLSCSEIKKYVPFTSDTSHPHYAAVWPSEFPRKALTWNCEHPPETCLDCTATWIWTCLVERGWDRITCPQCKIGYVRR